MRLARMLLMGAAILLLAGGYAASQVAYFRGTAPEYAAKIDSPQVALLAWLILVGSIGFYLWKPREDA